MDAKALTSRNGVEYGLTVFLALMVVSLYYVSPLFMLAGALGMTLVLLIFLKNPGYLGLLLPVILPYPFQNIEVLSLVHPRGFFILSLVGYIVIRQFVRARFFFSRPLARFTKMLACFLGATLISLIKTISELYATDYITPAMVRSTVLSDIMFTVQGFLLLYIIYYGVETLPQLQRLLNAIIAVSAVIALLGILQYALGGTPPLAGFLFDPEYRFYGRATSVFSNPNALGGFVAPMVVITFVSLVWGTTNHWKRFLFLAPALGLNILALFVSFSRAAVLQVLCGMLVLSGLYYFEIWDKRLSWKVVLVALLTLGLIFAAFRYYGVYMRARLASYQEDKYYAALHWIETTSDFQRKQNIIRALQTFAAHPLIGIGYNLFAGKKIAGAEYFGLSPHNQYLKILTEMGLFGFLPFIALFGIVIKTGLNLWNRPPGQRLGRDEQILALLLLSGFSAIASGYFFADSIVFLPINGYLWIFSGAIFALDRRLEKG